MRRVRPAARSSMLCHPLLANRGRLSRCLQRTASDVLTSMHRCPFPPCDGRWACPSPLCPEGVHDTQRRGGTGLRAGNWQKARQTLVRLPLHCCLECPDEVLRVKWWPGGATGGHARAGDRSGVLLATVIRAGGSHDGYPIGLAQCLTTKRVSPADMPRHFMHVVFKSLIQVAWDAGITGCAIMMLSL